MKHSLFAAATIVAAGTTGLIGSAMAEPITIESLKRQEAQVQELAERNLPATVALIAPKTGASGTGVIVSAEGLMLTAGHVIQNTEEITVLFPDGKSAKARSLGWNLSRDAAMAQLEGEGPWPHVEVGDSDSLKTTDIVVAMGHASGWDATRTPPIRIGRIYKKAPGGFLWSDCTLIGGDSGGPLFTLDGKLVGIHSSIGSSLTHNRHAGVSGFKEDWDELKKGERWGNLGGAIGEQQPIPFPKGPVLGLILDRETLKVREVPDNSPAGDAGIQADDILKSINSTALTGYDDIAKVLGDKKPGDEVTVAVDREGSIKEFKVNLGNSQRLFGQRENQRPLPPQWRQSPQRQRGSPGLRPDRRPALPDNGAFFGARFVDSEAGVVVIGVVTDSPAAKGGVQGGDIVTRIDDGEIKTASDVLQAIRSRQPGDKISVALLRGDSVKNLKVLLGDRPY